MTGSCDYIEQAVVGSRNGVGSPAWEVMRKITKASP